jgi:hypothetical protein
MEKYTELSDDFFEGCDFESASNAIKKSVNGRVIPIELDVLLNNYLKYPSKITAIALIKYNVRFAAFFSQIAKTDRPDSSNYPYMH